MSGSKTQSLVTLYCVAFAVLFFMPAGSTSHTASADDTIDAVVIRGSSTLQPVVNVWTDTFSQSSDTIPFEIVATGTSEGIDDLLSDRADIAMASRPMTQDELFIAAERELAVRSTIVARMGIAVIVNQNNPVASIEIDSLAKIFSGSIRDWQAVGGPAEPIVVVRKDSGWSPDFFRRRIMGDRDFIGEAIVVDSKDGVVAEVSSRTWSIGVTGMPEAIPALDRVRLVRLVDEGHTEVSTYALSRPLFFFTVEDSAELQQFLKYVTGEKAQEMIQETGFYPANQVDAISKEE